MTRVFVHPLAGVLSAYGMGLADQSAMREAAVEQPLDATRVAASASGSTRSPREAAGELAAPGRRRGRDRACTGACTCATRAPTRRSSCRSATPTRCAPAFEAAYRQRFAFLMRERALVVEAVSVEAVGAGDAPAEPRHAARARAAPAPVDARVRDVHAAARWRDARAGRARRRAPGARDRRPGDHRRAATRRPSSSPAGGRGSRALDHLVLERVAPREARQRDRHARSIR